MQTCPECETIIVGNRAYCPNCGCNLQEAFEDDDD